MQLKLFALLFYIGIISCTKNKCTDEVCQLPQFTQTGAQKMGCLINGRGWIPDTRDNGSIPRLKPVSVSFNASRQLVFSFYRQREPDDQSMVIYIKNFSGVGFYEINKISDFAFPGYTGSLDAYCYFDDRKANKQYITNPAYTGSVNVVYYDTASRIVSGTFQFKAQNMNGTQDSIIVTDGRFDCKIN